MLAKVARPRQDGRSSFAKLVEYIINRDDDEEKLTDELDPSDRRKHDRILSAIRDNLSGAEDDLLFVRRAYSIDANALRSRIENSRWFTFTGADAGDSDEQQLDGIDGGLGDGDRHQRSLARIADDLGTAGSYLGTLADFKRDFYDRVQARRTSIAIHAEATSREDQSDGFDDIEEVALLGDVQRRKSRGGVSCQHNCLALETAPFEMLAVAEANPRVKDPMYHVIISWPASEKPTDAQAFESGVYAMEAVGMAGHQYVFAIHRDTDNVHLHMAVNRVNPDTLKAVYPDRDFYKLDRAMRELELRFGFSHDNGPYAVHVRNGIPVVDWAQSKPQTKGKMPSAAADMEQLGLQESLFSYARGTPRKAIAELLARPGLSWAQLHERMAAYGLELRRKGRGLAVYVISDDDDVTPIKASDMHEELSHSRLVKRLGEFEPRIHPPQLEDAGSSLDQDGAGGEQKAPATELLEGISPVSAYDKDRGSKRNPVDREIRRAERAEARRGLRKRYAAYKAGFVQRKLSAATVKARYGAIRDDARRQRAQVRQTVRTAAQRRAMYSIIAFETLKAKERLKASLRREREALRADPSNRVLSFRSWVEKQAALGDPAAISQMRGFAYAEKRHAADLQRQLEDRNRNGIRLAELCEPRARPDLPGHKFSVRRDGNVIYRSTRRRDEFLDIGQKLVIDGSDVPSGQTLNAMLLHAAGKNAGAVCIEGSPDFIDAVLEVAAQRRLAVELSDEAQRRRLAERTEQHDKVGKPRAPRL
ncbi:TPA: TraI/MobA(P) family conjugative relaxase [Pseudomonas aeruginosa]